MRKRVHSKIYFSFTVALIALIGVSLMAFLNIKDLSQRAIRNQLALQALAESNQLARLVGDMESRARLSLLESGSPDSATRYETAKSSVQVSLRNLRTVSSEAALETTPALDEIAKMLDETEAGSQRWIDKAHRGETIPASVIITAGDHNVDAIQAKLRVMQSRLRDVTTQRGLASARSWAWTMLSILAASLIATAIVGWAFATTMRQSSANESTATLLEKVMDGCQAAVHVRDLQGRFLVVNRYAAELYGKSVEELLGTVTHLRDSFPSEFRTLVDRNSNEVIRTRETKTFEETLPIGGKLRTFLTVKYPVLDSAGRMEAICTVGTDISKLKEAEAASAAAREAAETASRFKDEFLSTMSHELRTPLNAVIGFSELLSDGRYGPLNERQGRYVRNIHTAGQQLLRLINDILDLSKIEAGRLDLAPEDLPLKAMVADVVGSLKALADKKSLTLTAQCLSGLTVRADATRLQQILTNLIGNAIKFTPEGGQIRVTTKQNDPEERVLIEVADNGPGISPEDQKRIFEAFYRTKESRRREGAGLGLAISRRLVEAQGGDFGLYSQLGSGSRFFFTLPPGKAIRSPRREVGKVPTSRGTILVAEDDEKAAQLIESQLAPEGYRVHWCEDSGRVVNLAAQLQPLAITLDILMKPSTGWEVLAQLKQDPRTSAIPVILISILEQKEVGALLGADDYLVKPVEKETLLKSLNRCLQPASATPMNVLVVEDDPAVVESVGALLEGSQFTMVTARDGWEAQKLVEDSLPSIVILDLLLPKADGFELLARWRADQRTTHLPVLVLTAKDLTAQEQELLRRQADGVFSKAQAWHSSLLDVLSSTLTAASGRKAYEATSFAG